MRAHASDHSAKEVRQVGCRFDLSFRKQGWGRGGYEGRQEENERKKEEQAKILGLLLSLSLASPLAVICSSNRL